MLLNYITDNLILKVHMLSDTKYTQITKYQVQESTWWISRILWCTSSSGKTTYNLLYRLYRGVLPHWLSDRCIQYLQKYIRGHNKWLIPHLHHNYRNTTLRSWQNMNRCSIQMTDLTLEINKWYSRYFTQHSGLKFPFKELPVPSTQNTCISNKQIAPTL